MALSSPEVARAAERLVVDHWTAEVVSALRAAGVRPILLKGPATTRWLTPDAPAARSYVDVDILVHPAQRHAAERVLSQLGFVGPGWWYLKDGVRAHAEPWIRPTDGANVDLHRTLHGCEEVPDERIWDAVVNQTETLVVGGVTVEVPGSVVRTMHLGLHASPEQGSDSQSSDDLRRGLAVIGRQTWWDAGDLARRLGVDAELGWCLRAQDSGRRLADELGLPDAPPPRVLLIDADAGTQVLARLATLTTWRRRARYLAQMVFVPPALLPGSTRSADRGPTRLVAAYMRRVVSCPSRLVKAVPGYWAYSRGVPARGHARPRPRASRPCRGAGGRRWASRRSWLSRPRG